MQWSEKGWQLKQSISSWQGLSNAKLKLSYKHLDICVQKLVAHLTQWTSMWLQATYQQTLFSSPENRVQLVFRNTKL